jgi:hypothetical protein
MLSSRRARPRRHRHGELDGAEQVHIFPVSFTILRTRFQWDRQIAAACVTALARLESAATVSCGGVSYDVVAPDA